MKLGAVIVAAGMSSRMGDFKPMLNIGSISISQRIVATLQQAGAERIVVVTGYNAEVLERHLARSGVVFLRNERYATTQMFDSACIGLSYMRGKFDRVFFTPVDIPLFTAKTLEALLASGAELACPVCGGERGHPILLSDRVIDRVLADSGQGGLQGALSRCGVEERRVEVEDAGILRDADTPDDYASLLEYHNSQLIRPVVHVSLAKERPFFDARVATLLSLVDETRSVRLACKRMQISYSSGWNLINSIEEELSCKLITRNQGGSRGGSSMLTRRGRELTDAYGAFTADVRKAAEGLYQEHFGKLL